MFEITKDDILKCWIVWEVHNESKVFCTYCGHWVFKNKKDEFMYRLKETMKHGREKDII